MMTQTTQQQLHSQRLAPRLAKVASFVREGCFLLDVGSDHAYLPIALVQRGTVAAALATDLNEGPILRAKEHIAACGLERKILEKRRDGLQGAENDLPSHSPTDIVIAGMGGELMVSILRGARFLRDPKLDIRLILQPNTRGNVLRRYLSSEGFAIEEDALVEEVFGGKTRCYTVFCAVYRAQPYRLSLLEEHFGREPLRRADPLCLTQLRLAAEQLDSVLAHRRRSNRELTAAEHEDETLLQEIETYLLRNDRLKEE